MLLLHQGLSSAGPASREASARGFSACQLCRELLLQGLARDLSIAFLRPADFGWSNPFVSWALERCPGSEGESGVCWKQYVLPGVSRLLVATSFSYGYFRGLATLLLLSFALVLMVPELCAIGAALPWKGPDNIEFWRVAVSSLVSATRESMAVRSRASAPARRTAAEAEQTTKGLTRRVDP